MTADPEPSMSPLILQRGSAQSTLFKTRRIPAASPLFKYKAFFLTVLFICITGAGVRAEDFKVVRVADGDTITILQHGEKVRVRLVGIDAPETSKSKRKPGQPYSQKSKKHLADLVLNKRVSVKSYGKDRYGRILGEVFLGGTLVNLEMVKVGLAEVYRGRPAKGLDAGNYWKAEEAARKRRLNIWSLGDQYVSPKEWRRRK
jgi:endonuclease YncB( thermonuclease family)